MLDASVRLEPVSAARGGGRKDGHGHGRQAGRLSGPRMNGADSAQQLAEMLGDVLAQAQAISSEARCCLSLGAFQDAARLCSGAKDLPHVCGLAGMVEIHVLKTEFPEARAMHAELAHEPARSSTSSTLLRSSTRCWGPLPPPCVRAWMSPAPNFIATAFGSPQGVPLCDAVRACLMLREGDAPGACALYEAPFRRSVQR
ncbi:hypothetical protein B0H15DRAFT_935421 [Mycena belliarum]|uniref:Uncharacterized protein n=1 Tax=Mycena belliarum TaxID=1033014 RepID=A0AAD6XDL5_9AGAR|nr:hypothetical protein B0H15DRAFT_935421 [Mycena belliae]